MRRGKAAGTVFGFSLAASVSCIPLQAEKTDLMSHIVSEMERFGEVATIMKHNEEYQPYIISVFEGKELEALGVLNLEEALSLVPGVDIATDNMNYKTPIFRGSNPFAFGQSKLLIDGILVNDLFLDSYTAYLSIPVEMIKRIEVVRGPGSRADGINAYAGSIHVVTYAEELKGFENNDKVVFKGGSYDYRMGGFVKSYHEKGVTLFTDFYYQEDNKKLPVGYDAASTGAYNFPDLGIDNSPLSRAGDAPLWLKQYALGIMLRYDAFTLNIRRLFHQQGSAYGINLHLPEPEDYTQLPSTIVELAYKNNFGHLQAEIKGGVKFGAFSSRSKLLPDGYELPGLSDPLEPTPYPDGFYGMHDSKQRTLYQSTFLKYRGWDNHIVTLGYRALKEETYHVGTVTTDRDSGTGLTDYGTVHPFFNKDANRDTFVFALEDRYDYSERLTLMYGISVDESSRIDVQYDPRISMVYRAGLNTIYKAIYSRSHRNPSWQEMCTMNNLEHVGDPRLEAERVDAFEAAYIRKFTNDSYFQANLFYLSNKDQIDNTNADNEFRNAVDTDIYGFELEFKGSLTADDRLYLNYAFVDGEDNSGHPLANVAEHLIKGYYTYNLTPGLSISLLGKYVGSKTRVYYDNREKLDGYATMDATLRYENFSNDYSVTLAVKNLFDADVRYPSEPFSYDGDYPQDGRRGMIIFSKVF